MNGLLSMIGMQAELDYMIGDLPACFGDTPLAIQKGNIPSDKQKCKPKAQYEFIIKGVNGEFYPCKPDIFDKTYEEVTE